MNVGTLTTYGAVELYTVMVLVICFAITECRSGCGNVFVFISFALCFCEAVGRAIALCWC